MEHAVVGIAIGLLAILIVVGLASLIFSPITSRLDRLNNLIEKVVKKLGDDGC